MTTTAHPTLVANARSKAKDYGRFQDFPEWEINQFADWYADHPAVWANSDYTFAGIGRAHQTWLRRP